MDNLTQELFLKFNEKYQEDPKNDLIRRGLKSNNLSDLIYEMDEEANNNFIFSNEIKTMSVTDQKMSGRCWIFAGLNVLREIVAKKLNLKDFELSQNYVALFDKLEKANYALVCVTKVLDQEPSERLFSHILHRGLEDGGQWDMFKNVVKKYGVVPKQVFKETTQSSQTREVNFLVTNLIRQFASEAKELFDSNQENKIEGLKEEYLFKIYSLMINAFGKPVTKFDFEYVDKEDKYHIEKDLTPKSFFDKYIGETIDEYVSIINSPTKDKPFMKIFTIDYLNNVNEGEPICHLNLEMTRVKELIKAQILNGNVVWFGSDVSYFRTKEGVWDDKLLDYKSILGSDIKFDKAKMLDFHASCMNHAMCITGINLKDNEITRYKIENSWGTKGGENGYYLMSSSWFDSFTYQAVILKKYLSKEELEVLKGDVIHLPPWDPMGTLAD